MKTHSIKLIAKYKSDYIFILIIYIEFLIMIWLWFSKSLT